MPKPPLCDLKAQLAADGINFKGPFSDLSRGMAGTVADVGKRAGYIARGKANADQHMFALLKKTSCPGLDGSRKRRRR